MTKLVYPTNGVYSQTKSDFKNCYKDLDDAGKYSNFDDSNVPSDFPLKKYLTNLKGYLLNVGSALKGVMVEVASTDVSYDSFSDDAKASAKKITITKITKNERLVNPNPVGSGSASNGATGGGTAGGGAAGGSSNGVTAAAKTASTKTTTNTSSSRMQATMKSIGSISGKSDTTKSTINHKPSVVKQALSKPIDGNIVNDRITSPLKEVPKEENTTPLADGVPPGEIPYIRQSLSSPTNGANSGQKITTVEEIVADGSIVSPSNNETPGSNA